MYRCDGYIDECISISCYEIDKDIGKVSCNSLDEEIRISCSIVCSINDSSYLRVNSNIIWLTSEMLDSADFNIISNTSWIIN